METLSYEINDRIGHPWFRVLLPENARYRQQYRYSPEQIVSHSFFQQNTEAFYEFYKSKAALTSGNALWLFYVSRVIKFPAFCAVITVDTPMQLPGGDQ